jgi:hypothetical protein
MRRALLCAVAGVAAVAAAGALAATGEREQHHFTAADQKAARTAVILRSDLGAGWSGGAKKPDLSPPKICPNWNPKQADLVLTGAAETDWKHPGLELETEAQVLQTAAMVKLDWQRTVLDPAAVSCLKSQLEKQFSGANGTTLVSFRRIAFPHVGTYSRAYVTTVDIAAGAATVPVVVENVLVGRGRTEITITATTAKVALPVAAHDVELLAKKLAARAKA